jgi:hypothetical protein
MTEELHINEQPADTSVNTSMTLNFKSNIFGDLSKITASNSLTIKLPKTARNRVLLDNPTAPSYSSSFPYRRHPARYLRNGVEVIKTAYLVLLPSGAEYETALYWGVMANYQSWVDANPSLRDLTGGYTLPWNAASTPAAEGDTATFFFADYNCGITLDSSAKQQVNIHPSANVFWILGLISQQNGITFEFPASVVEQMKRLALPCLDTNGSPESNAAEATVVRYPFFYFEEDGYWGFSDISGGSDKHQVLDKDNLRNIHQTQNATKILISIKHQTTGSAVYVNIFSNNANAFQTDLYINATLFDNESTTETIQVAKSTSSSPVMNSTGLYRYYKTYYFDDISKEILWGRFSYLRLFPFDGVSNTIKSGPTNLQMTITQDWEGLIYPVDSFPIIQNLPDIKQIDFIKAICAMFGLFAIQSKSDTNAIHFASVDEMLDNIPNAPDWSKALINTNSDEPATISRSIDGFAQHNIFEYKEDDTVSIDSSGDLTVEDETIEKTRTAITLPFAASDGNLIPQYKWNDDSTEVETQKVQPRIMRIVSQNGKAALLFDGLEFSTLISEYYSTYRSVINKPIVIKEHVRIDEYALRDLDYLMPVYLDKYGQYYVIKQLQAQKGSTEVELIRLPRIARLRDCYINGVVSNQGVVTLLADYVLASDVTVQYTIYNIGTGATSGAIVFAKGAKEQFAFVVLMSQFDRMTIDSVAPTRDESYKYNAGSVRSTNTIGYRQGDDGSIYLTATAALNSDISVQYAMYNIGSDEPYLGTVLFAKGATDQFATAVSRQFLRFEIRSLTPNQDDKFNYIIAT